MVSTNSLYDIKINEAFNNIDFEINNFNRERSGLPELVKPKKNVINSTFKATYPKELNPNYHPASASLKLKHIVTEILLSPFLVTYGIFKLAFKITATVLIYFIPFRLIMFPASYIHSETCHIPDWEYMKSVALDLKKSFFDRFSDRAIEVNLTSPGPDGVQINTCIVWHSASDRAKFNDTNGNMSFENTKWLFLSGGNATCYEIYLGEAIKFSNKLGVNVLLWNPRGVMQSGLQMKNGETTTKQATSANDIILDGMTAYQYLKSKGVKDEDIDMPASHSLGGAINTQIRAFYNGPICNDRSFSSVENLVTAQIAKISRPLAYIIGPLVGLIFKEANWEFDSLKAWQKNRSEFKRIISGTKDSLICGVGKLYTALKRSDPNYKKVKDKTGLALDPNAAVKNKLHHLKTDMGHVTLWSNETYRKALENTKNALRL